MKSYWLSPVGEKDDFGDTIANVIIDGKTVYGPWALMTPSSWAEYSGTNGKLGLGLGQKYEKQPDGKWLKVEEEKLASDPSDPLTAFKPKSIQGLYSFKHYEREDGAWYQVSVDSNRLEVTYLPHEGGKFRKYEDLNALRKALKEEGNK